MFDSDISDDLYDGICEDLHIHTLHSKDSKEIPEKYIEVAIERKMSYLGFSDHLDLDPIDKDYGYYKYEDVYKTFSFLREKYGDSINILLGLEVTYQSNLEKSVMDFVDMKPYDYIIGSIHRLQGFTVSGPHGLGFFMGKDESSAYNLYFEELEKMVEMNYFDIIGHFDVIKRYGKNYYGNFMPEKYREIIERILKKAVQSNMVLEINSSGYRQDLNEPYPNFAILEMYRDIGGKRIVLGSDAHKVNQMGAFLKKTIAEVLSIYDFEVVVYSNRKQFFLCHLSEIVKI